jgi:hypothetical protein
MLRIREFKSNAFIRGMVDGLFGIAYIIRTFSFSDWKLKSLVMLSTKGADDVVGGWINFLKVLKREGYGGVENGVGWLR